MVTHLKDLACCAASAGRLSARKTLSAILRSRAS